MAYWLFSIDEDDRQVPQLGHVEAFRDLALVGRAVAEIGEADAAHRPLYWLAKARPVPSGTCAPTMPWPPEKLCSVREHVHRAALALEMPAARPVSSAMMTLRIDAVGQHVAMVAIAGDHRLSLPGLKRGLEADRDRFLADIEVAEAADQAEAVELARPVPRSGG